MSEDVLKLLHNAPTIQILYSVNSISHKIICSRHPLLRVGHHEIMTEQECSISTVIVVRSTIARADAIIAFH